MHPKTPDQIVAVVLLDIAVIVLVARGMGLLARRLGQPAVVGEIVAGLILGPSLLGQFPGNPSLGLFPVVVRPYLNVVAQIGLVMFMFIVGLELDLTLVRGRERLASTISVASIALPFALGLGLAALVYDDHNHVAGRSVPFWPFALFVGVSMSITAFPVLARMLTERGMQRVEIGALALACASVDDVLAWSILAVVVAVASSSGLGQAPRILGEAVAFVVVMFVVVKPLLKRLADAYQRAGRLTPSIFAVVMAGFLGSAFVTGWIGLHVIFGAFLFGVIMTRQNTAEMFREILERLEQVSLLLLLPVFFVVTGLSANVTELGPNGLLVLVGVLVVAIVGKFAGAAGAARLQGLSGRKSRALGVLMNNRGLTELVILSVGVSLKVLDQSLFTILVLMAVITTIMTSPLLRLVYPERVLQREIREAERASLGQIDAYRVIAAIDDPARDAALVGIGAALVDDERPGELVLSRFIETGPPLEVASGLSLDLAEVASGLGEMQELSHQTGSSAVPVVVRSQTTDNLAESLLTQVEAIEGDVLLVPFDLHSRSTADLPAALVGKSPSTVALLAGPTDAGIGTGGIVEVRGSSSRDGEAALELGIRAADAIGVPLVLATGGDRRLGRRFHQLAATLAEAGLPAEVVTAQDGRPADTPVGGLLTVVAAGSVAGPGRDLRTQARELANLTGGSVLVVRAAESAGDDGVGRLLARLSARGSWVVTISGTKEDLPAERSPLRPAGEPGLDL